MKRETKYEIFVNSNWVKVTEDIFRSWNGLRRKNGRPFIGPVYYLGTNERFR